MNAVTIGRKLYYRTHAGFITSSEAKKGQSINLDKVLNPQTPKPKYKRPHTTNPHSIRIVRFRSQFGLSQTQLAKLLGVAPLSVARWEWKQRTGARSISRRNLFRFEQLKRRLESIRLQEEDIATLLKLDKFIATKEQN